MTPRGQCAAFLAELEGMRRKHPQLEILLPTQSLVFP